MDNRAKTVDEYLELHPDCRTSLAALRKILASTDLTETIKWGAPCYTIDGKNVIGMAAFESYVGLWFHQGVFLSDPDQVLINAQEGTTKALRQWRFESQRDIPKRKVKAYILEAIENQRAGKVVKADRSKPVVVPDELTTALKRKAKARKAFEALTKGKQREYADHISSAKREETRQKRLEKILPMIEAGVGLNDRYRNC